MEFFRIPIQEDHKSEDWQQRNPTTYPGTIKVKSAPTSGQTYHKIKAVWWLYILAINVYMFTLAGWDKARKVWSGWINSANQDYYKAGDVVPAQPTVFPVIEGIASVNNYVRGLEIRNDSVRIEMFDIFALPPNVLKVNPTTHPWLFDEFHEVNGGYAPEGKRFFFPRLAKNGIGWIELKYLEPVDNVPPWKRKERTMNRAHGIDISKWQTTFDLPSQPPNPIDFIVQRLSYAGREDEQVAQLNIGVQEVDVRGAYHYFSSGVNWKEQADLFLKLADTYGPFHFFALDFEKAYNKKSAGFALDAKKWIDYVAQETGKKTLLYTNPSIYREWLMPYTQWMTSYPLWIAQYYYFPSPTKNPSMYGMDRTDWKFYQYRSNGNGRDYGVGSLGVDLNVYNGAFEQLEQWLEIHPETPDEECEQAIIDAEKRGVQIGINKSRGWIDSGAVSDGYK